MDPVAIRTKVLANAVASLSAIDGVDAIYLSGSLAEKVEDQYSDIDMRVVVTDVDYDTVRAMRAQLPTRWGPFLFHQTVSDNLTVSYYDSLTKIDVFYFRASSVSPSPWFTLGTQILFERRGALRAAIQASNGLSFAETLGEVVSYIQKCIAGLIESAKRALRGELIYASRLSAEAMHNLFVADDLMAHRAPLGSSKRETLMPDPLTTLAKTHLAAPADPSQYFAELSSVTAVLLDRAVADGFCGLDVAVRLSAALGQLTLLSSGK